MLLVSAPEEGPPKFLIKSLGELVDFVQTVRVEGGEGEQL